jgi:hypothetical protein
MYLNTKRLQTKGINIATGCIQNKNGNARMNNSCQDLTKIKKKLPNFSSSLRQNKKESKQESAGLSRPIPSYP